MKTSQLNLIKVMKLRKNLLTPYSTLSAPPDCSWLSKNFFDCKFSIILKEFFDFKFSKLFKLFLVILKTRTQSIDKNSFSWRNQLQELKKKELTQNLESCLHPFWVSTATVSIPTLRDKLIKRIV